MGKSKIITRLTAVVLIVLMMGMMTMSVFADSKTIKPKYGVSQTKVTIYTPYQYRWFWQSRKMMTVNIKNTGNCGMTVYMKPLQRGCEAKAFTVPTVDRGSEKQVFKLPYDNCNYRCILPW